MGKKLVEIDFWRGIKAFIIFFLPEVDKYNNSKKINTKIF